MDINENKSAGTLDDDVEAHGIQGNENESVVEDDDVRAHKLSANENEEVVEDEDDAASTDG